MLSNTRTHTISIKMWDKIICSVVSTVISLNWSKLDKLKKKDKNITVHRQLPVWSTNTISTRDNNHFPHTHPHYNWPMVWPRLHTMCKIQFTNKITNSTSLHLYIHSLQRHYLNWRNSDLKVLERILHKLLSVCIVN